jgi:hypothetical protein
VDQAARKAVAYGFDQAKLWDPALPPIEVSLTQLEPLNFDILANKSRSDFRLVKVLLEIQKRRDQRRRPDDGFFDSGDLFILLMPEDWRHMMRQARTHEELVDLVEEKLLAFTRLWTHSDPGSTAKAHMGDYAAICNPIT